MINTIVDEEGNEITLYDLHKIMKEETERGKLLEECLEVTTSIQKEIDLRKEWINRRTKQIADLIMIQTKLDDAFRLNDFKKVEELEKELRPFKTATGGYVSRSGGGG